MQTHQAHYQMYLKNKKTKKGQWPPTVRSTNDPLPIRSHEVHRIIRQAHANIDKILSHDMYATNTGLVYDSVVRTMAKQHTTTYDEEGKIIIPPLISQHSCMGRYFTHYRRNIHDNKRQKAFINSCNFALTYPQKSKMLLHTITNECTSSIFRMINRTVKNHKQSASTPDCRIPGVSFHNDGSATRKNSKHTLSK